MQTYHLWIVMCEDSTDLVHDALEAYKKVKPERSQEIQDLIDLFYEAIEDSYEGSTKSLISVEI